MVEQIVRVPLVVPLRLAIVRVARKRTRCPLVVTGALLRIPRTGIGGSVVNEVERGIIGDPAPRRPSADFPGFRRPGSDAEILSFVVRIERLERVADQYIRIGPGVIRSPRDAAVALVQRGQPTADAHLAAA